MGQLTELKTTMSIVQDTLETMPSTRNSDRQLYYFVCDAIGRKKGISIRNMNTSKFLLYGKTFGFPTFETVRRARQKLQAENPELRADADVEAARELNEEAFKEYALS